MPHIMNERDTATMVIHTALWHQLMELVKPTAEAVMSTMKTICQRRRYAVDTRLTRRFASHLWPCIAKLACTAARSAPAHPPAAARFRAAELRTAAHSATANIRQCRMCANAMQHAEWGPHLAGVMAEEGDVPIAWVILVPLWKLLLQEARQHLHHVRLVHNLQWKRSNAFQQTQLQGGHAARFRTRRAMQFARHLGVWHAEQCDSGRQQRVGAARACQPLRACLAWRA